MTEGNPWPIGFVWERGATHLPHFSSVLEADDRDDEPPRTAEGG